MADRTGVDALAVMTLAEFEHVAACMSADGTGDEWSSVWDTLDPGSVDQDFRPDTLFERVGAEPMRPELREAWRAVFPHLPQLD